MYSEEIAVKETKQSSQPILQTVFERFEKNNAWQSESISRIEDKLNQFLDRRSPEKKEEIRDKPGHEDASSLIFKNISTMENNSHRLEGILKHLSEII